MKWLLSLALLTAGCSATPTDWQDMSRQQRQQALDAIADQCQVARSAFELSDKDEMHFRPDEASSYERINCALQKAKRLSGTEIGFVGNEAYSNESK